MRRAIISIILVLSIFGGTSMVVDAPLSISSHSDMNQTSVNSKLISEIAKIGSNVPIDQYMRRLFPNRALTISNSFSLLDTHKTFIDLSSYQVPGWTLYKVIIDTDNITAISEREVVGSASTPLTSSSFAIYETGVPSSDLYINQLAQGFYNMGHDGQLQNISLLYMSPNYTPAIQDYAYIDIRSDYSDGSTNMVSSVPLDDVSFTPTWANVTESVIFDANTVYYALINGTKLLDVSDSYPDIRWFYENTAGDFYTARYSTEYSSWGPNSYEAILNYTYIPWNKTSSSPLVFSDPSTIQLAINTSYVSGNSWIVNSANNITSMEITTNQSVDVFYNLTLCYSNDNIGSTVWSGTSPSTSIAWNVTTNLAYPAVSNVVSQSMNITNIPLDWSATGLFLGTSPGGAYSKTGSVVTCSGLIDGTWTLTSTAPNYAVNLVLSDSSDHSPIVYKVANLVTMDINATIEDEVGTQITGGTANLSILQSTNLIYSPTEIPANSGTAVFQWNISSTTDGNGTHSVEVYWISSDNLEAGYITHDIFVYHSTTLVADEMYIDAFTDDSFTIGIDFNRISPSGGLGDVPANVTYSFESVVNGSLLNPSGGRWTKVVDTTGLGNGIHFLTVYAEGFALENRSLVITVNLDHQTLPLNNSWSNKNNITYTEYTNLSISYLRLDGVTRISGATVNATIEGVTHDMTWDALTQTYWIELTGANFSGAGNFTIYISAWKDGFQAQNSAINITIQSETGLFFNVDYNPTILNISYIESLFIQVTYNFNSVPIDSSTWVRVMFNGSPSVDLDYNATSQKWEITLDGIDYLGSWDIIVRASAVGYATFNKFDTFTVYEDTPNVDSSIPSYHLTIDYGDTADFSVFVADSAGFPINDANVSFTAFGTFHSSIVGTNGEYKFSITPWTIRGPHNFTVYVTRTGYVTSEMNLTITVEATTSLTFQLSSYQEYEQWNITINALYLDSIHGTPILDASVNISLDGMIYHLEYVGYYYQANITLDLAPGGYTIGVVSSALYAVSGSDQTTLTVTPKRALHIDIAFDPPGVVAGEFMQVRATLLTNESDPQPVSGFLIRFEISIYFTNGTSIHYRNPSMTDTTNAEGLATWGFEVPEGQIDRLTATATYSGNRENWSAEKTESTTVGANILSLLFAFLMSDIGIMIIISMALLGIVAAGYNKGVKPKKRAARVGLQNQLRMFKDLETVQHFMAVYLDRGTCVFYHPFTDERIQPDLISGFIAAITSVYGEIKGDGVRGTLEEIQYHGLRLNSYSGQYIIGILILEGEMTPLLRERLQFFVELFENQYEKDLDGWTGLVDCFDPEWVVSTLNSAFNYAWHLPHRFGPTQKVNKTDTRILNYISAVRDERNEFYLKNLLAPLAEMLEKTEAEVLDRLLYLQDRGIIVPIGIQTILQRQGLALVNGSGEQVTQPPPVVEEPSLIEKKPKAKEKAKAKEEPPEAAEELQFDEITEESIAEPHEEVVEKPETEEDAMEAFVQDVESLLVSKAKEEKKEDDELDKFVKELRAKIGEDEDEESQD
jgi:hypothetical protein